ncbi:hypothetical protein BDU57DRAFT_320089 [Ampelomyces quisqualis]|uniref:Uncharacterized protein n=1 Tax=Ampelomyces quisqualis TaxID=50730 RepID=A0A6A5QFY9_AMPQU|nr:hypothetical protein BDU57DRAFT_320089 [Ampelomyces quisqualis]
MRPGVTPPLGPACVQHADDFIRHGHCATVYHGLDCCLAASRDPHVAPVPALHRSLTAPAPSPGASCCMLPAASAAVCHLTPLQTTLLRGRATEGTSPLDVSEQKASKRCCTWRRLHKAWRCRLSHSQHRQTSATHTPHSLHSTLRTLQPKWALQLIALTPLLPNLPPLRRLRLTFPIHTHTHSTLCSPPCTAVSHQPNPHR